MSFFRITPSTNFLMPFYSRERHQNRGITSSQIGPEEPSGLIYKVFLSLSIKILLGLVSLSFGTSSVSIGVGIDLNFDFSVYCFVIENRNVFV